MTTPEDTRPVQPNTIWQRPPFTPLQRLQDNFQITPQGSNIPIARSQSLFLAHHPSTSTDTGQSDSPLSAWYLPLIDFLPPDALLPSGKIFNCPTLGNCWVFNLDINGHSVPESAWVYVESDIGTGTTGLVGLDARLFNLSTC
ncbi:MULTISPECIES: hypothetical protein [unclassified Oceanobacter]|uniref:hypothetical protein n=1 Tax=unclassified Oceanobacter TaxID=2620260 RepID=UPI002735D284|nr:MULTISPECIES: hypothetical protein [unclassified Oceanobacter]MDP2607621.1 hypothetical protein [Oceanobacter sp. 1_MG-2023]MDP2610889.1 hypothetical protein [Oceanobacter sp. 2_MG-2023]